MGKRNKPAHRSVFKKGKKRNKDHALQPEHVKASGWMHEKWNPKLSHHQNAAAIGISLDPNKTLAPKPSNQRNAPKVQDFNLNFRTEQEEPYAKAYISEMQRNIVDRLHEKHGTNYRAMSLDHKINKWQWNPTQIKRLTERYQRWVALKAEKEYRRHKREQQREQEAQEALERQEQEQEHASNANSSSDDRRVEQMSMEAFESNNESSTPKTAQEQPKTMEQLLRETEIKREAARKRRNRKSRIKNRIRNKKKRVERGKLKQHVMFY
eukprot:gb/GECH01003926.1/.p1 GENE.gb/GECH01003926.1/~~gb/GECH01003926.1/.p1  ORF type:complete len:267 (+),score=91.29 gb/GECH01003926.1/:1-801(+)